MDHSVIIPSLGKYENFHGTTFIWSKEQHLSEAFIWGAMRFGVDAYRTSSYFFSRFWLIFLFPDTCRKASTIRATHLYRAQPKMLLIWGNCICISSSLALLSRSKHSCVLSALQCRPALCLPCHQPQNPPYGISLFTARWTTSVNASEGLTTWDAMEN